MPYPIPKGYVGNRSRRCQYGESTLALRHQEDMDIIIKLSPGRFYRGGELMEENMEYYWDLVLKDGRTISVPPQAVELVKKRWDENRPIHTRKNGSFQPYDIKSFSPSTKPYTEQKMIESISQAFQEPILAEDGSMAVKWVKKAVTPEQWQKYYLPHGYKYLREENGLVYVAFRKAIHQIDQNKTPECTQEEVRSLHDKTNTYTR